MDVCPLKYSHSITLVLKDPMSDHVVFTNINMYSTCKCTFIRYVFIRFLGLGIISPLLNGGCFYFEKLRYHIGEKVKVKVIFLFLYKTIGE